MKQDRIALADSRCPTRGAASAMCSIRLVSGIGYGSADEGENGNVGWTNHLVPLIQVAPK
jgi:hypothetical protein